MCSTSNKVLRVENLKKNIAGRPILRGVEFTVCAGEVVGLLGPNGAGKTTTFQIVAGLDRNYSGRVELCGKDLRGIPLEGRVSLGLGYLPQESSVFRGLTTEENLALVLELDGLRNSGRIRRWQNKGNSSEKAMELLEQFGLNHLCTQRASTLSGGERRRLEFARAICLEPKVLLCDEPLTGVDPIAASELRSLLRRFAKEGLAVLLTDHNVAEALPACDRAYILVDGIIADEGEVEQLAASRKAREMYLGDLWGTGAN